MKKILKLIILFVMCLSAFIGLTGCGEKKAIKETTVKMSEQERQIFNSQFEAYEGNNLSSGSVKALLATVETSNANHNAKVEVKGISDRSSIKQQKNYKVTIEKDKNGLVSTINIEEK